MTKTLFISKEYLTKTFLGSATQQDQNPPPPPPRPTYESYVDLLGSHLYELYTNDAEYFDYFVPRLCKAGLRQCHLSNAGVKIAPHIHITRQKR